MSYRNCIYDNVNKCVYLFSWDKDGKRVKYDFPFQPYLYVEDQRGKHTSLYNTKVTKKIFKSSFERNKFINESGIKRLFENLPPVQQYLLDQFWMQNEQIEFASNPLKICFIDIETAGDGGGGFPSTEDPQQTINVITCFDSITRQYTTFGLKGYKPTQSNVTYIECRNERILFHEFIQYLEKDYPDIISGWNSIGFDMPYIINRCNKVLGEEHTKRMSPVGNVWFREFFQKGRPVKRYFIDGISLIDYLDIYKRFSFKEHPSYKLDNIAFTELGENKVDYGDMSLFELADKDWQKFVTYNIQDVNLVVKLEEKLQFISLLRMLAYAGLCTFEQAMGTLSVINGALCIKAREDNKILSTFLRNDPDNANPGAYVAEPVGGFQEHIVSFDANSLYPNVMISLNLSPETKIGRATKKDNGDFIINHVSGKTFELTKSKFVEFLKTEEVALSKANILFTQKFKGVVPRFVDDYYQKRVVIKKELSDIKKKLSKIDKNSKEAKTLKMLSDQLNAKQMCVKVLINSCYGYFGNKQAPIGDDDIASSVTLTGQAVIKQSNEIAKAFIKKKLKRDDVIDPIIYNDTDSTYVSMKQVVDELKVPLKNKENKISDEYNGLVEELNDFLNQEIIKWGTKAFNSKDCRFIFKRESIADVGLFLQKKRYVLHVLNEEGIDCDKFKYTGVEVARTTMPDTIKPYAKKIIETMLLTKSLKETNSIVDECYKTFKQLSIEDISFVMGVKGYEKYATQCKEFTTVKSMPIHVKSAYYYNTLLTKHKLSDKYEKVGTGDKIRYLYVETPNKYGIESIGFKYDFPKEFEVFFKPNYDLMFEKILFSMIERFYHCVNWSIRKPADNVQTELFDLFS